MAKKIKLYSYFGWIEAKQNDRFSQSRIRICDNFSGKIVQFDLPAGQEGIVQLANTEQHILFLGGPIWLYQIQTVTLFKLGLSTLAIDEFLPIFLPVREIPIKIANMDDNRLDAQFSHWEPFQRQGWTTKSPKKQSEEIQCHFLVCTAFSAFLTINNCWGDNGAKLVCLFEKERPRFSNDEPCSSFDQSKSCSSYFFHKLHFSIKKICGGHDHLALLSSTGHVYTCGTGTKGELGNNRVEKRNWREPPKLVKALAEAGIRIVDVECGNWHSVALNDEGDLYGWGWNGLGQLGHPPEEFAIQPTPFPFEFDDGNVQEVHCAGNSTFVLIGKQQYIFGELEKINSITTMASIATGNEEIDEQRETTKPKPIEKQNEVNQKKQQTSSTADDLSTEQSPSAKRPREQRLLRLAIAGCSHGQMDTIYGRLEEAERQRKCKFDLLICCGDFQAIRNHGDLHYYHAPAHHRKLGTFYKYYSGEKVAPVLTLFVGGNHESSGYMAELPNGGWVAPNIYYMGYASVIQFAGLRIVGISGIYKSGDFDRGHFERPPFQEGGSIVSAYHVRSLEIFRLRQLKDSKIDICISHDWPAGITDFGDRDWLLHVKPHFTQDIQYNRLGNPATMNLLYDLKPSHWFAAHMHVRFTAVVPHNSIPIESQQSSITPNTPVTRFLALDKPIEKNDRQRFLEFMDFPITDDSSMELCYDPQWLGILKSTDELTNFTDKRVKMPDLRLTGVEGTNIRTDFRLSQEEMESIQRSFGGDNFHIPLNFQRTAPPELEPWNGRNRSASLYYRNPQSQQFCERLEIRDLNLMFAQSSIHHLGIPFCIQEADTALLSTADQSKGNGETQTSEKVNKNPDEIDLGDDEFGNEDFVEDVKGET